MSGNRDTLMRQWQMLRMIPRAPRKITAEQLHRQLDADGYVTSKRTVERDLVALSESFPVLCDDRDKPFGWQWLKDAKAFDIPGLSNNEALTFKLVEQYLRPLLPESTLEQLQPYFSAAQKHLDTISEGTSTVNWINKIRVVPPTQPLLAPAIDVDAQHTVYEALLHQLQVEVTYQKPGQAETQELRIHPIALVQRGQIYYLVCTVFDYSDIRMLAMHRIRDATQSDAAAVLPNDFDIDHYIASGAFGFTEDAEKIELELTFYDGAGNHLEETPLSLDQKYTRDEDGTVHVKASVLHTEQLYWWLQSFGSYVQVLAPTLVRDYMQEVSAELVSMYKQSQ